MVLVQGDPFDRDIRSQAQNNSVANAKQPIQPKRSEYFQQIRNYNLESPYSRDRCIKRLMKFEPLTVDMNDQELVTRFIQTNLRALIDPYSRCFKDESLQNVIKKPYSWVKDETGIVSGKDEEQRVQIEALKRIRCWIERRYTKFDERVNDISRNQSRQTGQLLAEAANKIEERIQKATEIKEAKERKQRSWQKIGGGIGNVAHIQVERDPLAP